MPAIPLARYPGSGSQPPDYKRIHALLNEALQTSNVPLIVSTIQELIPILRRLHSAGTIPGETIVAVSPPV